MKIIDEAVNCIKSQVRKLSASTGIITGSGWDLSTLPENVTEIHYQDIPGFPTPTVGGHKGRLIHGYHNGIEIILLQGRVHYYEGYSMDEVTFPVKVLQALGVKQVVITNAAGGIRPDFKPGDFMLVTDHINMMGVNPLRGKGNTLDKRFVDMTEAYDRQLAGIARDSANQLGIMLHTGILAALAGPSYETPAEIRMLSALGADAVCMSTVPEVIMSRYLGMEVLAISMITNHAAGISTSALRHEDVVNMAEKRSKDASRLIAAVINNMPR